MDLTHMFLSALVGFVLGAVVFGLVSMKRLLKKDEAIDAATFLALRELREQFRRLQ